MYPCVRIVGKIRGRLVQHNKVDFQVLTTAVITRFVLLTAIGNSHNDDGILFTLRRARLICMPTLCISIGRHGCATRKAKQAKA